MVTKEEFEVIYRMGRLTGERNIGYSVTTAYNDYMKSHNCNAELPKYLANKLPKDILDRATLIVIDHLHPYSDAERSEVLYLTELVDDTNLIRIYYKLGLRGMIIGDTQIVYCHSDVPKIWFDMKESDLKDELHLLVMCIDSFGPHTQY